MVGYKVKNKESINHLYVCSACTLLLRDPVQLLECGHRLCYSCVEKDSSIEIMCPECHTTCSLNQVMPDRGFKKDMQFASIMCRSCSWMGSIADYETHLDRNHSNTACDYCGNIFTSINDLNEHEVLKCEKVLIDCELKSLGCGGQFARDAIRGHYSSEQHQTLLLSFLFGVEKQKSRNERMVSDSHDRMNTLLSKATHTTEVLKHSIEELDDDIHRVKSEFLENSRTLRNMNELLSNIKLSDDKNGHTVRDMRNKQNENESMITKMQKIAEYSRKEKCDGSFLWKISHVAQCYLEARSEKQLSIDSPPFYSSLTGYRMCLRLYLNGDGSAKDTHISLFVVLMRGVYDPILQFPFNYKIIFCLYDQTGQENHIIDGFTPDVKLRSFQRPTTYMNSGGGVLKFVSTRIFEDKCSPYIRDDTMYIRVLIDFYNLSEPLISYFLKLNSGLPKTALQMKLYEEAEKQQVNVFQSSSKDRSRPASELTGTDKLP